jgi:hypothetical protein
MRSNCPYYILLSCQINRINEERIAAGKSTLGFLNPTLYEHPQILNDITNGTNPGCTLCRC